MIKTGGGSTLSSLFGAISAKLVASLLGPAYVGLLATLQQTRQAALMLATANGQTALVQGGAFFREREREEYLRTVLILFAAGTTLSAAVLFAAGEPIARLVAGSGAMRDLVAWLALPVALASVVSYLSGLLNSARALGRLALTQVVGSMAGCLAVYPAALMVNRGHPVGLIGILTVSAGASLAVALILLRSCPAPTLFRHLGQWISARAVRHFFAISGAMMGTGLVASGVLLAVRSGIIQREGLYRTGLFDAAWAVSMSYVTLLLGSCQAYYLPTLSRMRVAEDRAALMERVLRVWTLAAIPIVTSLVVLKPVLLVVLYSGEFRHSVEFLRWTLIGDYLKITSWILAMPMLALADMKNFVLADVAAYAAFLCGARLVSAVRTPAEAAAIAFASMYVFNLGWCYAYARLRCSFRPTRSALLLWLSGLVIIGAASLDAWADTSVHLARAAGWMAIAVVVPASWVLSDPSWLEDLRRSPAA